LDPASGRPGPEWAGPILESQMSGGPSVGSVRVCRIADLGPFPAGTIAERLTVFDPEDQRLVYEAVHGMPGFVCRAVNRWSVHPAPGGCVVRVHATLTLSARARPLGPLLALRVRGESRRVLDDLRHRVQTGRPHPRKVAAAGVAGERGRRAQTGLT
jgi:Polyketide cyclase / dehydrase and lipid transport